MRLLALAVFAPTLAAADVRVQPLVEPLGTDLGGQVVTTGFCDPSNRALVLLRSGAIVEVDELGAASPVINIGATTSAAAIACDGTGRITVGTPAELVVVENGSISRTQVATANARFARTLDDGSVAFVGEGVVTRWDGKQATQWQFQRPKFLNQPLLTGDGSSLALIDSGTLAVVDSHGNRADGPRAFGIAWSPDFKSVLVLSSPGLSRWLVGDSPSKLAPVDPTMRGVQLYTAGSRFLAKTFRGTTIFSLDPNGRPSNQLATSRWPTGITRVASGGGAFAVLTDQDHAYVVDLTKAGPVVDVDHPTGYIGRMAFSPDSKRLVFRGGDDDLLVFDDAGKVVERLVKASLYALHVKWTHDDTIVAASGTMVTRWSPDRTMIDARGTHVVGLDDNGEPIDTQVICPRDARSPMEDFRGPRIHAVQRRKGFVAVACASALLLAKDGQTKPIAMTENRGISFALAGSKKPVVFVVVDRTLKILDAKGTRDIATVDAVAAVAASPDGKRVAVATARGDVTIYSEAGKPLLSQASKRGKVTDLAWAPNNKRLAVSAGFAVDLWDL